MRPVRTVLRLVAGRTTVERRGDLDRASGTAAVIVHHSQTPAVSLSMRALVAALVAAGYQVLVVSSSTFSEPLDWCGTDIGPTAVLRKPNVGYDFGSWAVGLAHEPWIAHAEHVILANDSLAGPFGPIDHLLAEFHSTPADVWGLTETLQFSRHLQSYAVGYRGGVLAEPALAHFWRTRRHYEDKQLVIHHNEIGLGRLLQREGFTVDAAFVAGSVVDPADNPTIIGWRTLLDRGLPFVKRELVRSPGLAPDGADLEPYLRSRYGIDVREWV